MANWIQNPSLVSTHARCEMLKITKLVNTLHLEPNTNTFIIIYHNMHHTYCIRYCILYNVQHHWLRIITRLSALRIRYSYRKIVYKIQVKFSITYPESLVMVMILSQWQHTSYNIRDDTWYILDLGWWTVNQPHRSPATSTSKLNSS